MSNHVAFSGYLAWVLVATLGAPPVAAAQEAAGQPTDAQESPATTARGRGRGRGEAAQRAEERVKRLQDAARARRAAREGASASDTFTHTARLGRDGIVEAVNVSGRITVAGGSGDDVRVEAVKRVWHRTEDEARAVLKELEVRVTEGAGRVGVRPVFPRGQGFDAEVELTLTVPSGSALTLRTTSGDIDVSNVRGELRAEAAAGSVTARAVGDVRLARAVSGSVSIDGATGSELTASTLSGPITVRQAKTRTIDLRSVGGTVRVSDSESDRVTMQALSGSLEYAGRIGRGGRYDLLSRSGSVTVVPVGSGDFDVEATTLGGTLRSDFPLTLRETSEPNRVGRGRARVVQGTAGSGGGLLTLRSLSGSITIARR
jgi:DUF4097 and DUF4098 domain-containing protein YvlB